MSADAHCWMVALGLLLAQLKTGSIQHQIQNHPHLCSLHFLDIGQVFIGHMNTSLKLPM